VPEYSGAAGGTLDRPVRETPSPPRQLYGWDGGAWHADWDDDSPRSLDNEKQLTGDLMTDKLAGLPRYTRVKLSKELVSFTIGVPSKI